MESASDLNSSHRTSSAFHENQSPSTHTSASILKPPLLRSADPVLDKFVVSSAVAYASQKRASGASNTGTTDQQHESLCNFFLKRFQDPKRYRRYLNRRGEEAQNLIDSIQNMLDSGFVDEHFRVILVVALTRLVSDSELYPRRFILEGVTRQEGPLIRGKFGFIGKGTHAGKLVCIKVLRLNFDLNARVFSQALLREMVPWAQLHHENVLPFHGVCRLSNGGLGFISSYLENGNVIEFLKRSPDTDRIPLILGAASGMAYLHDMGIVHGGIKGQNILITDTSPPQVRLADYGFANITDAHAIKPVDFSFTAKTVSTKPFLAPELLNPAVPCRRNEASDVYAFSMTSYQILTGCAPFSDKTDYNVIRMILKKERPPRSSGEVFEDQGLNDGIWQIIEDSWSHDPLMRPSARRITERLSAEYAQEISRRREKKERDRLGRELLDRIKKVTALLTQIFNEIKHYKCLLASNAEDTQSLLDGFQLLLDTEHFQDRGQLIAAMRRLSARTELYPLRFLLNGSVPSVADDPLASGNFADIYKVTFQGEATCFKVIRVYQRTLVEHMAKVYAREVIVWGQLSHPNILPFYGLSTFRSRISFVSPWAENGHLSDYLARNLGANRILLCSDTAAGIDYLHKNDIVHGDLKGVNVLVEASGRACLGDFGLSSVTDPDIMHWTSQSSMASHGGTARWQAPELHETEADTVHNSKESDVFAWANLCYEIFTGRLPFFEAVRESTVIMSILRGGIPTRPQDDDPAWLEHGLNVRIWDLMKDCWKFEPSARPDIGTAIARLKKDKPHDFRLRPEWERRVSMSFRNAQDANLCENIGPSLEKLDHILSRIISI